jgi:hypothetical protein
MGKPSGWRRFAAWALAGGLVALIVTLSSLTYLFTHGRDAPSIPPSQRIAVLEQAKARGVIDDYEVLSYSWPYGQREYLADDAVRLLYHPGRWEPGWYFLTYPIDETEKGSAIAGLARRTRDKVVVAPPYSQWKVVVRWWRAKEPIGSGGR